MNISRLCRRVVVVLMLSVLVNPPATAGEISAAVAANFTTPMQQIAEEFEKDTGNTVKLSFGSTGKFYAQIKNGAPFDVFIAADSTTPRRLEQEGMAVSGSLFVYALGKLVLWSAQSGYVDNRGEVLRKGGYSKLAIADPKLAPYGMAAKEALVKLELWDSLQSKLVTGENISQAYHFAATGNAELGFVALSQVMHDGKLSEGSYWLLPASMYNPIRQSAMLLSGAKNTATAQAFLDFLKGKKAAAIIRSFGYELP